MNATPEVVEAPLSRHDQRIADAHKALGLDEQGSPLDVVEVAPPVYDERGNVRPRGTEGAKPMTHAQRVKLAAKLRGA